MGVPVLLIVDVQRFFTRRGLEGLPVAVETLLPAYKTRIATRFVNPGGLFVSRNNFSDCGASPDTDLAFTAPADLIVRDKPGYGLEDTGIIDMLQSRGVDEVHLAGCESDCCVLASAFDLWDAGIAPAFHLRAIGTTSDEAAHSAAIRQYRRLFGEGSILT